MKFSVAKFCLREVWQNLSCTYAPSFFLESSRRCLRDLWRSWTSPKLSRGSRSSRSVAILSKGAIKPWRLGSRKMITLRKNALKALADQASLDLKTPGVNCRPRSVVSFFMATTVKAMSSSFRSAVAGRRNSPFRSLEGSLRDHAEYFQRGLRAKLLTYQVERFALHAKGADFPPMPAPLPWRTQP